MLARSVFQAGCCLKNQPASRQASLIVRLFHVSTQVDGYYTGNFPDPHNNLPRALQNKRKPFRQDTEPQKVLEKHLRDYDQAKRWLGRMMGEDSSTYTQDDVNRAVEYLMPSSLFAKDARPMIQHPETLYKELFQEVKKLDPETDRPFEPAFYTGSPNYHNLVYKTWEVIDELHTRSMEPLEIEQVEETQDTTTTPAKPKEDIWITFDQFKKKLNEQLYEQQYDVLFNRFKRIINDPYVTEEILEFLKEYQIDQKKDRLAQLDETTLEGGVARAMGYRKTATADVFVSHGTGEYNINKQMYTKYFRQRTNLEQIAHPFLITGTIGKYNIEAYVIGGGLSAQAGALRNAVSRAIATLSPELRSALDEARLLDRDMRVRERKKPGRKAARMKYAWRRR